MTTLERSDLLFPLTAVEKQQFGKSLTPQKKSIRIFHTNCLNVVFWNWSLTLINVYPPGWIADMLSVTRMTSKGDTVFHIKLLIYCMRMIHWRWDRRRPEMFWSIPRRNIGAFCVPYVGTLLFVFKKCVAKDLQPYFQIKDPKAESLKVWFWKNLYSEQVLNRLWILTMTSYLREKASEHPLKLFQPLLQHDPLIFCLFISSV